ncbi:hypothetical protein, partial [Pseudomonas syringae group genomosp. 7]|uniref:hypothetical protein n=1 Tax=Pseudomonas syringae group genomosp. 7 TaxID=251699 RepID=UPI003770018D
MWFELWVWVGVVLCVFGGLWVVVVGFVGVVGEGRLVVVVVGFVGGGVVLDVLEGVVDLAEKNVQA